MSERNIVEYLKKNGHAFGYDNFEILKVNSQNTFLVARVDVKDASYLLKIADRHDNGKLNKLDREIYISKFLDQTVDNEIKFFTRVIRTFNDNGYLWLLREFVEGSSLAGYASTDDVLMGYDKLDDRFIHLYKTIIPEIVEGVSKLQQARDYHKFTFADRRFYIEYSEESSAKISKMHSVNASQPLEIFNSNRLKYFSENNMKISISDLVPPNVIYSKHGRVYLTDFEWMTLDNRMLDFAQLWLYLWRYPDWQDCLIGNIAPSTVNKENFRLSTIRALLTFLLDATSQKQIKYYGNHVWKRYLIAAGESFEALMKVE